MRVLLDEDVPIPLARKLLGHEIKTVLSMGWAGIKNGWLLGLIEQANFQAFITGDKNIPYQQTLDGRPYMILIMSTTHWPTVKRNVTAIAEALVDCRPGSVTNLDCGSFSLPGRGKVRDPQR